MQRIVERAGLQWVFAMDADTLEEVNDYTERVFAVVREQKKMLKQEK